MKHIHILLTCFILISGVSSASASSIHTYPLEMRWGIPPGRAVSHFEDLEHEIQGETIRVENNLARVTMERGSSYIFPISAYSRDYLSQVRYLGRGIPHSATLEWLDPWSREWYLLDKIPAQAVEVITIDQGASYSIDFGPPEGALFEDGIPRFIWFRITPHTAGNYRISIYGYRDGPPRTRVSNTITLECTVE